MIRLLVVDDKEENLYLLQACWQATAIQVTTARHGAEALLKAHQEPPGLIISDLLMPVMDGFTLLRLWKADERLKCIPFVVYTATYTEPKDERLALDLGADAFIIKPAEPECSSPGSEKSWSRQRPTNCSPHPNPQLPKSRCLKNTPKSVYANSKQTAGSGEGDATRSAK